MLIAGLQKTTLIDFPGRVACTVFTLGCNFRCPFCHNKDLVTQALFKKSGIKHISEKDFFEFLAQRKKILDGVNISGGEPTLQPDLEQFCQKIKSLGLEVKLDTNGSKPEIIRKLIKEKLVDFIAMDVKTNFEDYSKLVKPSGHSEEQSDLKVKSEKLKVTVKNSKLISNIKRSIKLILQSGIEYEFRTTVVPGMHDKKTIIRLARELKLEVSKVSKVSEVSLNQNKYDSGQAKANWVLQKFRPQNCLDPKYLTIKPYTDQGMKEILITVQKILPFAKLRGIEQ